MKFNPDCIRDILLSIENEGTERGWRLSQNQELVNVYSRDIVVYHIRQCDMNGLLDGAKPEIRSYYVRGLTPKGYDFLNNVRDNSKWKKILDKIKSVGISAVNELIPLVIGLAGDFINKN